MLIVKDFLDPKPRFNDVFLHREGKLKVSKGLWVNCGYEQVSVESRDFAFVHPLKYLRDLFFFGHRLSRSIAR